MAQPTSRRAASPSVSRAGQDTGIRRGQSVPMYPVTLAPSPPHVPAKVTLSTRLHFLLRIVTPAYCQRQPFLDVPLLWCLGEQLHDAIPFGLPTRVSCWPMRMCFSVATEAFLFGLLAGERPAIAAQAWDIKQLRLGVGRLSHRLPAQTVVFGLHISPSPPQPQPPSATTFINTN